MTTPKPTPSGASNEFLAISDDYPLDLQSARGRRVATATFPLALSDAVADLAARERSCCGSWHRIAIERDDGAVHVTLTAEHPDGVAAARSLAGLDPSRPS